MHQWPVEEVTASLAGAEDISMDAKVVAVHQKFLLTFSQAFVKIIVLLSVPTKNHKVREKTFIFMNHNLDKPNPQTDPVMTCPDL